MNLQDTVAALTGAGSGIGRALALAETLPNEMLLRLSRSPDSTGLPADPRFQQLMLSHHIQ